MPPGLAEFTGLSNAELKRLISPFDVVNLASRETCAVNDTSGGVFAGPALPSAQELLKRNSFVAR